MDYSKKRCYNGIFGPPVRFAPSMPIPPGPLCERFDYAGLVVKTEMMGYSPSSFFMNSNSNGPSQLVEATRFLVMSKRF